MAQFQVPADKLERIAAKAAEMATQFVDTFDVNLGRLTTLGGTAPLAGEQQTLVAAIAEDVKAKAKEVFNGGAIASKAEETVLMAPKHDGAVRQARAVMVEELQAFYDSVSRAAHAIVMEPTPKPSLTGVRPPVVAAKRG